jgi:hypothetical protein
LSRITRAEEHVLRLYVTMHDPQHVHVLQGGKLLLIVRWWIQDGARSIPFDQKSGLLSQEVDHVDSKRPS